jgi:thiamine biosynthesis lipoprotein ApbE
VLSVTVVHPTSAMLADGLSTVMFIFGREKGEAFLKSRHPEARAVWVMKKR